MNPNRPDPGVDDAAALGARADADSGDEVGRSAHAALGVVELGERPYAGMLTAQERLVEARRAGEVGDLLLLLEHPPVYTRGRRSGSGDLAHPVEWYEDRGIAVHDTPRGGQVTYHGPGQLVAYPIIDLRGSGSRPGPGTRVDVPGFVASIERAMAAALGSLGIEAGPIAGLTGLWAGPPGSIPAGADAASMAGEVATGGVAKIGSIGLLIGRGISSHGLSLNISCDLEPFQWITSCGIERCRVTSVAEELATAGSAGAAPASEEVGRDLAGRLATELDLGPVTAFEPAEIGLGPVAAPTA